MALSARKLIDIIGRMNPAAYDVFFPRFRGGTAKHAALLGPDPWPMGPANLQQIGASMAREMMWTLWINNRRGTGRREAGIDFEIWCPVGAELLELLGIIIPVPVDKEGIPRPNWAAEFYLGFAGELARQRLNFDDANPLGDTAEKGIQHALTALEKSVG